MTRTLTASATLLLPAPATRAGSQTGQTGARARASELLEAPQPGTATAGRDAELAYRTRGENPGKDSNNRTARTASTFGASERGAKRWHSSVRCKHSARPRSFEIDGRQGGRSVSSASFLLPSITLRRPVSFQRATRSRTTLEGNSAGGHPKETHFLSCQDYTSLLPAIPRFKSPSCRNKADCCCY